MCILTFPFRMVTRRFSDLYSKLQKFCFSSDVVIKTLLNIQVNMFLFNVPVRNKFSHAERELQ